MAFVNKMDRAGADFFKCYDQMKSRLKANPIPIQVPIGAAETFTGVFDLVKMKAVLWEEENFGIKFEYADIPDDLKDGCQKWHDNMVETAAEANEDLMNKYLETGELSEEEIKQALELEQFQMRLYQCYAVLLLKTRVFKLCSMQLLN